MRPKFLSQVGETLKQENAWSQTAFNVVQSPTCLLSSHHFVCADVHVCFVLIPLLQIEHLKACLEIATSRTINWQQFCQRDEGLLVVSLFSVVIMIDAVASFVCLDFISVQYLLKTCVHAIILTITETLNFIYICINNIT